MSVVEDFVINEPQAMFCCGRPVAQCNCQHGSDSSMLGLPVWNWQHEDEAVEAVTNYEPPTQPNYTIVNKADGPDGGALGLPVWHW